MPRYKVSEVKIGLCTYHVDVDPTSKHGGPIEIWEREDNGNSCGSANWVEDIEQNIFLIERLEICKCLWLMDVCRGLKNAPEIESAFKSAYFQRYGKHPEIIA